MKIGGQEGYCYIGGQHECTCLTYGHGLNMVIQTVCPTCIERGCHERVVHLVTGGGGR